MVLLLPLLLLLLHLLLALLLLLSVHILAVHRQQPSCPPATACLSIGHSAVHQPQPGQGFGTYLGVEISSVTPLNMARVLELIWGVEISSKPPPKNDPLIRTLSGNLS